MKKFITRAAVVILIGGMSVAIGGCYGPFRLTSKLHHWNGQVSQKKFVNGIFRHVYHSRLRNLYFGRRFDLQLHRMVGRPESDQHERRATGRSEVRL